MQNRILPLLFIMLFQLNVSAQTKQENERAINYLEMEFQSDYNYSGALGKDVFYWVGFDKKSNYEPGDIGQALEHAVKHITRLKDKLQNPSTQKNLKMVLLPDNTSVVFNLKERDNGKEFAFYNNEYAELKTSYDTVQIIQRKKMSSKGSQNETYVLYTVSLKDINDFQKIVTNKQLLEDADQAITNKKMRMFSWGKKFQSDFGYGIMVNSILPIAPYFDAGYMYVFNKDQTDPNAGRPFLGIHISGALGMRKDTVWGMSNIALEFGGVKLAKDGSSQKASILVGLQFLNKQGTTDRKPSFMLGLNFPVMNSISAGLQIGGAFAKAKNESYVAPNSNIGVTVKFNF